MLYNFESKECLKKIFRSKIFLSLGWGHLQVKRQNSRKNSIHDFLANYTILSLNNFLKKIFGQIFFQVWGGGLPTGKELKLRNCFKTRFFAKYTIISQRNF